MSPLPPWLTPAALPAAPSPRSLAQGPSALRLWMSSETPQCPHSADCTWHPPSASRHLVVHPPQQTHHLAANRDRSHKVFGNTLILCPCFPFSPGSPQLGTQRHNQRAGLPQLAHVITSQLCPLTMAQGHQLALSPSDAPSSSPTLERSAVIGRPAHSLL